MNNLPSMKTALISLLAATLLGIATFASGRPFDAADFVSIAFAAGLAGWTFAQYDRTPRLLAARPIRLPLPGALRPSAKHIVRLAA